MKNRQLFLGLDCSSQSLSAVLIDYGSKRAVYEQSVNFDRKLPQYRTVKGFLRSPDPAVVHSPPLMWVEALDLLLDQMVRDKIPLNEVLAIGGSAQQHGSVYLNSSAGSGLASRKNLEKIFSRKTSPVWMDSSTTEECREIRKALGGMEKTIELTGSNTFERFTGPQIRKFYKREEAAYEQTAHIALVSSFMASLLAGKIAPIDYGDGSGMNLMDIRKNKWDPQALDATATGLLHKLPPLAEPSKMVGKISAYFVEKFGFSPETLIQVWSGDNPNSLVGLGLVKEGLTGISLGTSYTYFGYLKECRFDLKGESHLFASPIGNYMSLICFKNGALAIEAIRNRYSLDWSGFDRGLQKTPPGNRGGILLPYFEPEIVPHVEKPGLHHFDLKEDDGPGNCRAVIEGQMMSMRLHSRWMKIKPSRIYATGGVSTNPAILQIVADVFNCPVVQLTVSKSTALGAALRAAQGYLDSSSWEKIVEGFFSSLFKREVLPHSPNVYDILVEKYAVCEKIAIAKGSRAILDGRNEV